jgi:tetratricopeptide (TPR) repeat protein
VGITFTLEELVPLLEGTRSVLLPPAARNLVTAGFALEEAPEEARYAFRQTLMREIVYDSQPYARRRELHARLAAYLEARPGGDPAAEAELLAHHYRLAHRWLPAARYLLICGRKARQRYAYDGALSYFEEALQALERLPAGEDSSEVAEIRAQLHEGVGDVALLQGDLARAASAYREARVLLEAAGADAGARLLRKQALVLPVEGRADEAEAAARLAWERRAPEDAGGTAALLAWLLWRVRDAESEVWGSKAQELVAERQDEWAAGVRVLLADLADEGGARRDYLALERRTGAALLDCRRGDRYLEEGDLDAALTLYERAGELWQQEEDAQGLALVRYRQARVRIEQGDRDTALALLERTLSLLEDAGSAAPEERGRVRELLEQLHAGQDLPWPTAGWQRYDDAFRISLLFDPEELQTA